MHYRLFSVLYIGLVASICIGCGNRGVRSGTFKSFDRTYTFFFVDGFVPDDKWNNIGQEVMRPFAEDKVKPITMEIARMIIDTSSWDVHPSLVIENEKITIARTTVKWSDYNYSYSVPGFVINVQCTVKAKDDLNYEQSKVHLHLPALTKISSELKL